MGCLKIIIAWFKDILRNSQHFSNFSEEDILNHAVYFTKDEEVNWSFSVYISTKNSRYASFHYQTFKRGVFSSQIGIEPLDFKSFNRNGLSIRRIVEDNKERFFIINNGKKDNFIFASIPIFKIGKATYTGGKDPYFHLEPGKSIELKIKEKPA